MRLPQNFHWLAQAYQQAANATPTLEDLQRAYTPPQPIRDTLMGRNGVPPQMDDMNSPVVTPGVLPRLPAAGDSAVDAALFNPSPAPQGGLQDTMQAIGEHVAMPTLEDLQNAYASQGASTRQAGFPLFGPGMPRTEPAAAPPTPGPSPGPSTGPSPGPMSGGMPPIAPSPAAAAATPPSSLAMPAPGEMSFAKDTSPYATARRAEGDEAAKPIREAITTVGAPYRENARQAAEDARRRQSEADAGLRPLIDESPLIAMEANKLGVNPTAILQKADEMAGRTPLPSEGKPTGLPPGRGYSRMSQPNMDFYRQFKNEEPPMLAKRTPPPSAEEAERLRGAYASASGAAPTDDRSLYTRTASPELRERASHAASHVAERGLAREEIRNKRGLPPGTAPSVRATGVNDMMYGLEGGQDQYTLDDGRVIPASGTHRTALIGTQPTGPLGATGDPAKFAKARSDRQAEQERRQNLVSAYKQAQNAGMTPAPVPAGMTPAEATAMYRGFNPTEMMQTRTGGGELGENRTKLEIVKMQLQGQREVVQSQLQQSQQQFDQSEKNADRRSADEARRDANALKVELRKLDAQIAAITAEKQRTETERTDAISPDMGRRAVLADPEASPVDKAIAFSKLYPDEPNDHYDTAVQYIDDTYGGWDESAQITKFGIDMGMDDQEIYDLMAKRRRGVFEPTTMPTVSDIAHYRQHGKFYPTWANAAFMTPLGQVVRDTRSFFNF